MNDFLNKDSVLVASFVNSSPHIAPPAHWTSDKPVGIVISNCHVEQDFQHKNHHYPGNLDHLQKNGFKFGFFFTGVSRIEIHIWRSFSKLRFSWEIFQLTIIKWIMNDQIIPWLSIGRAPITQGKIERYDHLDVPSR